jgi:hypothetical protein
VLVHYRGVRGLRCLLVTSPLHSKQQHGDAGCEQEESDEVKPVVEVLYDFGRFGLDDLAFRDLAEEDQSGDNGARRKVDVDTPTPTVSCSQHMFWEVLREHLPLEYLSGLVFFCRSTSDDKSDTYVVYCVSAPPIKGPMTPPSCAIP